MIHFHYFYQFLTALAYEFNEHDPFSNLTFRFVILYNLTKLNENSIIYYPVTPVHGQIQKQTDKSDHHTLFTFCGVVIDKIKVCLPTDLD